MRRLLPSTAATATACACLAAAVSLYGPSAAAAAGPKLGVPSAGLIVAGSGRVLYGRRIHQKRAIASTTKMMTALLTMQHVKNFKRIFTQTNWVATPDESSIHLRPGERMSVRDLFYALLLPSANDAAVDLAYNIGHHSVPRFLHMMNVEAGKLGLHDTHYTTPNGLDTPGNYSSAYDLVKLARYLLAHYPRFRRVVRTRTATLKTGDYVRHIVNTDLLLGRVPWIHGVKTGYTGEAGYVLVSEGRLHGFTLIGAILHASSEATRDSNALALMKWGFSHFRLAHIIKRDQVLGQPDVQGTTSTASIVARRPYSRVVPRSAKIRLVNHLQQAPLVGPMAQGQTVGTVAIFVGSHRVGTRTLVLAQAIPQARVRAVSGLISPQAISLVVLASAVTAIAVGAGVARRKRQRLLNGRTEER